MTAAIVSRCTRNGYAAWSGVAKPLGVSEDTARRQYDPDYCGVRRDLQ
jgi:hypothetical protein